MERSKIGTVWRVSTSATGLWVRSTATRQASAASLASAGRITSRCGIARSEASCSIGWWVGPSSPSPIESWVKRWMTGSSISAESRIRAAP